MWALGKRARSAQRTGREWTMSPRALGLRSAMRRGVTSLSGFIWRILPPGAVPRFAAPRVFERGARPRPARRLAGRRNGHDDCNLGVITSTSNKKPDATTYGNT